MIEFNWELNQVVSSINKGLLAKQATFFLRPHDAIWGENPADFSQIADEIITLLPSEQMQRQFLSVCLGSFLLNPSKAPKAVPNWIQGRIPVPILLGIDISLDDLLSWRWGRAAFPVLDQYENGKNDTIYYALVAKTKSGINPLYPSWALEMMNADAIDAVTIAAELAEKAQPDSRFFFWPFINPLKPTHDRSLGLPVYLSFISLAIGKAVPTIIATGEVDRQGRLYPVHGVLNKCVKAFEKKYKKFIYPEDGTYLEKLREQRPVAVASLYEAECQWGIRKKATVIDDSDKASLMRHVQTICSAVLGSDNLPYVLITVLDTKHEEVPPGITATHEYLIVVDITKARHLKPQVREAVELFIRKEVFNRKTETINWIYWGEGEQLTETVNTSIVQSHEQSVVLPSPTNISWLKTDTILPKWLDRIIFESLGASYQPDYKKFSHNLNLNSDDLKIYLGTYFPRSYSEAFCIMDALFDCNDYRTRWENRTDAWVLDIGTGTGGNLIGLFTALVKHCPQLKTIHLHGYDGNTQALNFARHILESFSHYTNLNIDFTLTTNRIDTLDQLPLTTHKSFDFITSCKVGAEIISMHGSASNSFYYCVLSSYMNLLSDVGLFILLDVTTKTDGIDYYPQLLNEQSSRFLRSSPDFATVIPVPCYLYEKDCRKPCFTQKEFRISHRNAINDLSRVSYRIIARKTCADLFHGVTVADAEYVIRSRAANSSFDTCSCSFKSGKQLDGFRLDT